MPSLAVVVCALGYFVDVYDIQVFLSIRVSSLAALGLSPEAQTAAGLQLFNLQLAGMFLGGLVWGSLADRYGRLSALYGSIVLYSVANLANAWVGGLTAYGVCRFIAGFGLAGELGAGIALVSELLPPQKRGYGAMVICVAGAAGGVTAGLVGSFVPWRWAFGVGGALGLSLLVLRLQVSESALFTASHNTASRRAAPWQLFQSWDIGRRAIFAAVVSMPIWFFKGLCNNLVPEIAAAMAIPEPVSAARAITIYSLGLMAGDFASAWLSQQLQSRKRALGIFTLLAVASLAAFGILRALPSAQFYALYAFAGFATGYGVVVTAFLAEQFGTNLRATATTVLPNIARAMAIPASYAFASLRPTLGLLGALLILGLAAGGLALGALAGLRETFGTSLDFLEET